MAHGTRGRPPRRPLGALCIAATLAAGCARGPERAAPPATFVGEAACASCHVAEAASWQGSHHQLAMQPASDSTVLGDFRDASFTYGGLVSRFFRRDGAFMVRTDGQDGKLADYAITYTFGVSPLQQYLVSFPGGRMQALPIAWDTRPRAEGGQRWFHLYPGEHVTFEDELHWTRAAQNWNLQCAACHSTDLHKNYSTATRTYRTSWSDVNVACEACHGPGSRHVEWAAKHATARGAGRARNSIEATAMGLLVALDERRDVTWARDAATGLPRRSRPRATDTEIEACARCHASRTRMFDDDPPGSPLLASHLPALLVAGRYHADGQVDGEVYEYGSFLQSRMYHEGVTCSDCHDPHRLSLRAEGNALCLTCHDTARYDTVTHHHHANGSPAAQCVTCHMPEKTYMVVHPRRDHSMRVPRPDVADSLGTPDVCASCHAGKPAAWALAQLRAWYGHAPEGFQRFAGALGSGQAGGVDARTRMLALATDPSQPAIARATAASALGEWADPASVNTIRAMLSEPDPLLRLGAVLGAGNLPQALRPDLLAGALGDSVRVLRALAGGALAGLPSDRVPAGATAGLERAKAEYVAAETENSDQPFGLVNLGNFLLAEGDAAGAERAFRGALEIDPDWIPAYANLADLLRGANRDAEGETLLRAGLARRPGAAALHHALGLCLVRLQHRDAALVELGRAATLAPDDPRFALAYAVGLSDAGRTAEALAVVERALRRSPGDGALTELRSQLHAPASPTRGKR
jgi:predicted CXXCH cytochrome family protein